MTTPSGSNLLLSALSPAVRTGLLKQAKAVELPIHTILLEQMETPRYVYFLLSGLVSVVTARPNGESAEVCFVGVEGMVGGLRLLGRAPLPMRWVIQLPGSALRVPFPDVRNTFEQSSEFRQVLLEFIQEETAIMAEISGCNRLHNAEQRLIRWLLMAQDRVGEDKLQFTQEYLAQMIATQRTTVTATAQSLQQRGLIRYSRGNIRILDRPGMEAAACACYAAVRQLLDGLYKQEADAQQVS